MSNHLTNEMIGALEGAVGDSGMSVDNKQGLWLALAELREHRARQSNAPPGMVSVPEVEAELRVLVDLIAQSEDACCDRICTAVTECDAQPLNRSPETCRAALLSHFGLAAPTEEVPK